jgi:3-oxoacyl-[acyl-carrier protein] reductase
MNLDLKGKTALIGGSTQGIGWAVAKELANLGARCILLARNEQKLKELTQELNTHSLHTHSYEVADYSELHQLKRAIEKIVSKEPIHILINNTGGPKPGLIQDALEEDFEKAFSQHLLANQLLTKAVLPGMKEAGFGRIINVISSSVKIPIANLGVSNTIRAAVASWSKTLSNEVAHQGITVNSILPGYIDTGRLRSLISANALKSGKAPESVETEMINTIPAGRFGSTEEIANIIAFLATPAASYINGVSIPVDGGRTGTI